MAGGRPLSHTTVPKAVRANTQASRAELRNPIYPGDWVFVGDPLGTGNPNTPVWQNSFTWVDPDYVGFRHGLDGQLDMIGVYDFTAGAVSGTVAFTLPPQYLAEAPLHTVFPMDTGSGTWSRAVQVCDQTTGDVTLYWPA